MTNENIESAQRIIYMLSGKITDHLTDPEKAELENWVTKDPSNQLLCDQLSNENFRKAILAQWNVEDAENALLQLKSKMTNRPKTRFWPRLGIAASILICLGMGYYVYLHGEKKVVPTQIANKEIRPGANQATLTLADGRKIILRANLNGKLANQGNTSISVNSGQALVYTAINGGAGKVDYNTLTTKIGEQSPYPLILGDGTKVWLNAASSITFPTAFKGRERIVRVTGEAFFEVAHNASQPFKVSVHGQTINDIGTSFDINAYMDEPETKTTLIEGRISIAGNGKTLVLKPGQQAIKNNSTNLFRVEDNINGHAITAWKDGYFRFDMEKLPLIMREFSRWYNIDVVYERQPGDQLFNMKISRKANLSRALEILEEGGVNYRLDGRTLIITP